MAVILRTDAIWSGSGLPGGGLSTLYWLPGSAGGSTADATDCLDRFMGVFDAFKAHISTSLTVTPNVTCLAIEATTGVLVSAFTGTSPGAVVGTGTGDVLPRQTQGLLRWGTASVIAGRRVRGRLFIPGPVEDDNTSAGIPTGTYTSVLATSGGSILVAGATSSEACVWHRPKNGSGGGNADITSATPSSTWSVLRSRRA